jgi:serine/threonine protein kinase
MPYHRLNERTMSANMDTPSSDGHMMQPGAKTVGRYELLSELGRGAMGVVYKARDPKIDRLVAIKTISIFAHTAAEDREFRDRLVTEAKAAGRLSHPGIVTVYDVGEDPDTLNPYIVMEYVAGDSLEKQVAESAERFPLSTTLALVEQVAEALDYAHSQGIVHRDIKPANILLPENGPPKITDFGIAKFNFGHPASPGEAMGTPAFMSPEQLNGEAVDGRSDLFSLGVVLYTLLTGYRPFQGNSALTISFKVVNRNPLPATAFDSAFPPELDYVISRAMAKDPAQRYPTGRELAADLRALREALGQGRGPDAGSFDAVYLQSASSLVHKVTSPKQLASGPRTRSHSAHHRHPVWRDWRYISSALLAFAVLGMVIAILPHPRTESAAPIPTADSSSAKTVVEASSLSKLAPSGAGHSLNTQTANRNRQSTRAKTAPRRPSKQRNLIFAANGGTPLTAVAPSPVEASPKPQAMLRLHIEHRFQQAQVFLWVDDKLTYDQPVDGVVRKRMVVFKGVEGYQSDSVRLVPGEHRFRVRVHAADDSYDQTGTISATLPQEGERQLLIQCEKHKPVHLTIQ